MKIASRSISILAPLIALAACSVLVFGCGSISSIQAPNSFTRVNLVSDIPGFSDSAGLAAVTDTNLKNPWGVAFSPSGPFWVADNKTSVATAYNGSGAIQPVVVNVPGPSGGGGSPTGQVYNQTTDFAITPGNPAIFIFATEEGTIAAWRSGSSAVTM